MGVFPMEIITQLDAQPAWTQLIYMMNNYIKIAS